VLAGMRDKGIFTEQEHNSVARTKRTILVFMVLRLWLVLP